MIPSVDNVRLGWTLIHFLWQGVAIAAVIAPLLWLLRYREPRVRYVTACAGLILMSLCPVVTWSLLDPGASASTRILPREGIAGFIDGGAEPASPGFDAWLPAFVYAWIIGAACFLARFAGGWLVAWRRSRIGVETAPEWLLDRARHLAGRLQLRGAVAIRTAARAVVPQVFGWWRPVILLPAAALAQLSPAQLEMILAHELSHIHRRDYLVNLFQTLAESLLFYQPAVWWISARIRAEREHCCDDLAVTLCGDSIAYSRTLLALEQGRPMLAPAATSGHLRSRIARLLGAEEEERMNVMPVLIPILVVGAGLLMAAPPPPDPPAPPAAPSSPASVSPAAAPAAPAPVAVIAQAPAAPPAPAKAPDRVKTPPPPPPPPPPPARDRHSFEGLTSEERARVREELDKAREEIEKARAEMDTETRKALAEARRELEVERPKIEAEIKAALAELKNIDSEKLSAHVKRSLEQALKSIQTAEFQKEIAEVAMRAALQASAEALQQVEKNLSEVERQSAVASAPSERERRIRYADEKWKQGNVRGSETDRGRVYVQNGPPDEIESRAGQGEFWRYRGRDGKPGRQVDFDTSGKKVKEQPVQ